MEFAYFSALGLIYLFIVSILVFLAMFTISFVFSLWLVFYVSRGRFTFFTLFLVILLSIQYFFILSVALRSYVYFGPEASVELVKNLTEQSLTPSDLEEVVRSPFTSSRSVRFYLAYLLVFFGFSFLGGSLFYYYSGLASPSYPVVDVAFARGPLIVLPENFCTVLHIVNTGPVPILEWPYVSSYVPVDLPLGLTTFKELLNILPLLDMDTGQVDAGFASSLLVKGYSGVTALHNLIEASILIPLDIQNFFVPGMFTEVPVEIFFSLPNVLSDEELVHMSNFFPSFHPLCLAESVSAETYHELHSVASLDSSYSTDTSDSFDIGLVPAELVPSPWHW